MSVQNLPVEVLLNIFGRIFGCYKKRDICQCALVCKSWSNAATQVLYNEVELQGEDVVFVQLSLLEGEDQPFRKHGNWVNALTIRLDNERDFDIDDIAEFAEIQFKTLLSYMPNLKKFDIGSSDYSSIYLELLRDMDNNFLNHLEEITAKCFDISPEYEEMAFLAYLNFSQSLTHLELCYRDRVYKICGGN